MKPPLSLAGVAACAILSAGPASGRVQPQASTPPTSPQTVRSVAELAPSFGGRKAVTRPSHDSTMSFTYPVEVGEILVKGGQSVKKGDLLVRGRDDEARHQRDLQKLIAESDLEIQRAQAAVDQAKVEVDAHEATLEKNKGIGRIEYDRARTSLTLRQAELAIAKLNRDQQVITLALRQSQLDRFSMLAPFDGRVDKVTADLGEVKRETEPVVRIVSTDPLRVEVTPSTHETLNLNLKPGDKAWVLFDVPGDPVVLVGAVTELAADAEYGADSRRVRVEVANPKDWPSGITAWVRFTPPEGEWLARVQDLNAPKTADAGASAPVAASGAAPQ
jgi:RND family efflux transporter MFP subunit